MTDLAALTELLEMVEAGTATTMAFEDAGFDGWAELAYFGSLDAAKALHEAVLPGYKLSMNGPDIEGGWHVYASQGVPPATYACHPDLARAWLIAIIRAKIAEEQKQ